MQDPPYDVDAFAKVVTRDASEEGGSAPACSGNIRAAWPLVRSWALNGSAEEKAALRAALRLCPHAKTETPEQVDGLMLWLQRAWDYMVRPSLPPSPCCSPACIWCLCVGVRLRGCVLCNRVHVV